jgi:hypothetical protein
MNYARPSHVYTDMRSSFLLCLLAIASLVWTASPARAETADPPPGDVPTEYDENPPAAPPAIHHDGFYLRDAFGPGYTSFGGSVPVRPASLTGLNEGVLLLGGTPRRGLVVGGGIHAMSVSGHFAGGVHDGAYANAEEATLGPFFDWYPDPTRGFHLGALAGVSGTRVRSTETDLSAALGGTLFAGYDWWVGPRWSLGVLLEAIRARP